jgi:hypothetical protein
MHGAFVDDDALFYLIFVWDLGRLGLELTPWQNRYIIN